MLHKSYKQVIMKRDLYMFFAVLLLCASCQSNTENANKNATSEEQTPLSVDVFTAEDEIDPNIYFPTQENVAADPSNSLMEMFRKKKAADMANPDKPRPMKTEEIGQIENVSHQQPWSSVDAVFDFEWDKLDPSWNKTLEKVIKCRVVFDNLDLKVVELAIAAGATLPMHAQATPSVYHVLGLSLIHI